MMREGYRMVSSKRLRHSLCTSRSIPPCDTLSFPVSDYTRSVNKLIRETVLTDSGPINLMVEAVISHMITMVLFEFQAAQSSYY